MAPAIPTKRPRGRPVGSGAQSRIRAKIVDKFDVKPLEVMMLVLADRWNASKSAKDPDEKKTLEHEAFQAAEKVAPYLHPKLQATTIKGDQANPLTLALGLATAATLKDSVR